MPDKNSDKNKNSLKELEKKITPILVVNNPSLKPYIESFNYAPENIYQQPLGSLVGFFEIRDYTEDSAYIVNFLTSVLKKEYFINPKRSVSESLDSALHKVNIALSEIAKHGNVNWLGKLDGAICILEKNNLHFGVTGNAKVFLSRNQIFTNISEGLFSEDVSEPHPLKTFVNVSSGRLEKSDKLIITSDDVFHIITAQQLSKNAQRFEQDKFIQFLKTAMTNELEMAYITVIDILEPKSAVKKKTKITQDSVEDISSLNVFSEKAFEKPAAKLEKEELLPLIEETESNYTDKKTGHIYIQGEEKDSPSQTQTSIFFEIAKENVFAFLTQSKKSIARNFSQGKKSIAKATIEAKENLSEYLKKRHEISKENKIIKQQEKQRQQEQLLQQQQELELIKKEEEKQRLEKQEAKQRQEELEKQQELNKKKISVTVLDEEKPERKLTLQEKIALAKQEITDQQAKSNIDAAKSKSDLHENSSQQDATLDKLHKYYTSNIVFDEEKPKSKESFSLKKLYPKLKLILPNFSKAKILFAKFTLRQKIYTAAAIISILILPVIFLKFKPQSKPIQNTNVPVQQPTIEQKLSFEKNISFPQKETLFPASETISVYSIDNVQYIVTKNSIISSSSATQKEFSFAENAKAVSSAYMQDLNLIFIVTDQGKVISFSPASEQYKDNKIEFPNSTNFDFIATYLTYMYVIDSKNSKIYRYPRAEGGFGEKTDWLKENISLTQTKDVTIDDNIYVLNNNSVLKLFKGKQETFALENSTTPINIEKIFTTTNFSYFYVLDKTNGRIIQYTKSGELIKQYANEELKNATAFTVDEKSGKAYFATSSSIESLTF